MTPTVQLENIDAVMREHRPAIFRFVLGWLRDTDAAETVVQDCFLRAYRGREQFRAEASLKTWLMHIALNLVRDYGRNRRLGFWRQVAACPLDLETVERFACDRQPDPLERLLAKEREARLQGAVAVLPEPDRRVFLLRYVEGLAFPRISAITGLGEGAVKGHAYRALERVKLHLAQAGRSKRDEGLRRAA